MRLMSAGVFCVNSESVEEFCWFFILRTKSGLVTLCLTLLKIFVYNETSFVLHWICCTNGEEDTHKLVLVKLGGSDLLSLLYDNQGLQHISNI